MASARRAYGARSTPAERAVLLVRFNASHDSWELEDNVSEELAAAFRESHG